MTDKIVGYGRDSKYHGRQHSRIWMISWRPKHTRGRDLYDILDIKTIRKVGFGWYIIYYGIQDCFQVHDKFRSYPQNPTARSKSYWALGAQVPTQFPCLPSMNPSGNSKCKLEIWIGSSETWIACTWPRGAQTLDVIIFSLNNAYAHSFGVGPVRQTWKLWWHLGT